MGITKAAQEFEKITHYAYIFTLVKDRHSTPKEIVVRFAKEHFFHLCGLHKLKRGTFEQEGRDSTFDKIVGRKFSDESLAQDPSYSEIKSRVELLENVCAFFDSDDVVFQINKKFFAQHSSIKADYLISRQDDRKHSLFYISEDKKSLSYFGRSCFKRSLDEPDVTQGHKMLHIIKKERVNLDTNERVILSQMVTNPHIQPVNETHTPTITQPSAQSSAPSKDAEPPPATSDQPKYLSRAKRKELKRNAQQAVKQPQASTRW